MPSSTREAQTNVHDAEKPLAIVHKLKPSPQDNDRTNEEDKTKDARIDAFKNFQAVLMCTYTVRIMHAVIRKSCSHANSNIIAESALRLKLDGVAIVSTNRTLLEHDQNQGNDSLPEIEFAGEEANKQAWMLTLLQTAVTWGIDGGVVQDSVLTGDVVQKCLEGTVREAIEEGSV